MRVVKREIENGGGLQSRFYVNKTRLGFYSSNFTRVALCKYVCVFFAILISKSVSRAIFDKQHVYFIRKVVVLVILVEEKEERFGVYH